MWKHHKMCPFNASWGNTGGTIRTWKNILSLCLIKHFVAYPLQPPPPAWRGAKCSILLYIQISGWGLCYFPGGWTDILMTWTLFKRRKGIQNIVFLLGAVRILAYNSGCTKVSVSNTSSQRRYVNNIEKTSYHIFIYSPQFDKCIFPVIWSVKVNAMLSLKFIPSDMHYIWCMCNNDTTKEVNYCTFCSHIYSCATRKRSPEIEVQAVYIR